MDGALLVHVLSEALDQLRTSEQLATARGLPGMLVNGKPFTIGHIDALDDALFVVGANLQVEYASVCMARGIEP